MEFLTKKGKLIYNLAQEGNSLEIICDTLSPTVPSAKVIKFLRNFETIPKPLYDLLHDNGRLFQFLSAHEIPIRQIKSLFGDSYKYLEYKYGVPKKRYGFDHWWEKGFQRKIGIKILRDRGKTYQEIGEIFRLSRQRVEQLYHECLALREEDIPGQPANNPNDDEFSSR